MSSDPSVPVSLPPPHHAGVKEFVETVDRSEGAGGKDLLEELRRRFTGPSEFGWTYSSQTSVERARSSHRLRFAGYTGVARKCRGFQMGFSTEWVDLGGKKTRFRRRAAYYRPAEAKVFYQTRARWIPSNRL